MELLYEVLQNSDYQYILHRRAEVYSLLKELSNCGDILVADQARHISSTCDTFLNPAQK